MQPWRSQASHEWNACLPCSGHGFLTHKQAPRVSMWSPQHVTGEDSTKLISKESHRYIQSLTKHFPGCLLASGPSACLRTRERKGPAWDISLLLETGDKIAWPLLQSNKYWPSFIVLHSPNRESLIRQWSSRGSLIRQWSRQRWLASWLGEFNITTGPVEHGQHMCPSVPLPKPWSFIPKWTWVGTRPSPKLLCWVQGEQVGLGLSSSALHMAPEEFWDTNHCQLRSMEQSRIFPSVEVQGIPGYFCLTAWTLTSKSS